MIAIIGLGNPEKKYKGTRHNLGKEAIDFLYKRWKKKYSFSNFEKEEFFQISKGKIENENIYLVKNLTFMNESGKAVKDVLKKLKIEPENILILHDDLDINLGKIKIVKNKGSAGHKGVDSIIKTLKTKNFLRIRIGIKPKKEDYKKDVENFVLKKFTKKEKEIIKRAVRKVLKALELIIKGELNKAMSFFNK